MESLFRMMVPVAMVLSLVILIEQVAPRHRVPLRERFPGIVYLPILPILVMLAGLPLSHLWQMLGVRPLFSLRDLHPAVGLVAALLILDFLRYVEHRLEHRLWWPVHSLHHAPASVHASSVLAHPLIAIPEFFVIAVPLSFLDIGVAGYFWLTLAVIFQDFVIHSPLSVHLGPLRRLIVDNRFHRIHHSLEPRHFDRNFAITFSIWDRLFGTAHFPAKGEWPDVGVEGIDQPRTAIRYIAAPLANLTALKRESRRSGEPAQITADI